MNTGSDILIVGQTPPPYHGQAVVTSMLFDHDWGDLKVESLRMSYSDSIDAVGKLAPGKLLHLLSLILKTWWIALTKKPEIFYYLPASANKAPVIRDILYLNAVRWCFPKTIFHYHAGGLPLYLNSLGKLGEIAKKTYADADVSIDVIETEPPSGSFFASKENVVVRNGIDAMSARTNRDDNGIFQIIFVGLLSEGKGVMQIVETAKILRDRNCQFHCKVVGGWSSEAFHKEVETKIKNDHLEGSFQFTGPLSGADKWQAYADADCFFFPSHYEAETFGIVLVEAMAYNLPLVTSRWRGIPRVVEGGNCAILCDIKSPNLFADALEELSKDADKRKEMGKAARKHYEACYTRERFINSMEKVFVDLLKV